VRPAAGVGADERPAPQTARQLRQRQPGRLDVVGGGVGSRVPRAQDDGQRAPFPAFPWSAQAVMGWNPRVFFQVGTAFSFSEWAITVVASRSTVTRPPPAP
jgi:hypothetical protein